MTQVSTRSCLAQSNPGTLAASPVLTGFLQHFRDFLLVHFMVMNMRRSGHRVDIESGAQACSTLILTRSVNGIALKPTLGLLSSASRRPIVACLSAPPQPPAPRPTTGRQLTKKPAGRGTSSADGGSEDAPNQECLPRTRAAS